jgi:hypothetical protein
VSTPPGGQHRRSFALGGADHELDLLPDLVPGSVTIVLDGKVVAKVRTPSLRHPWIEQRLDVGAQSITVVLTRGDRMMSDLFVGGVSVIDGRSLSDACAAAPVAVSGYNWWMRDFSVSTYRRSRRELAGFLGFLGVGACFLAAVGLVQGLPLDRAIRFSLGACVFLAVMMGLILAWSASVSWVHAQLLRRPQVNDAARLLIFCGSLIGIPIAAVVAFLMVLVVLAAFR